MIHHNLKLFDEYYQDVIDGKKLAENRFNDRNYQVGDTITLHEGCSVNGEFIYSGRKVSAVISHINSYGMQEGYVSLSLDGLGLLIIN